MICEPIALVRDNDGNFHFHEDGGLPLNTVIDMHNMPFGRWVQLMRQSVIFELDGREVVYERIAVTPEGYWICRLKIDPANVHA